jgi:hypothetical protein
VSSSGRRVFWLGLSVEMAIRFEKAFGIKADTMLRMQAAYDLAQARMRQREIVVERVAARRTQRSNISCSVGIYIINRTLDIPVQAIR